MTDKEKILHLEKNLAICRKTMEKLSKENAALKQEVGVGRGEISFWLVMEKSAVRFFQ
jgi:hypothetical protein